AIINGEEQTGITTMLMDEGLDTGRGRAGYNLGYAGKWHVDRNTVPTDHGFRGKDFPGYGYPPAGGVIDGLRFGGAWRRPGPSYYADYLKARGLEAPKVLQAFYGDNMGKLNQEMYALQTGDLETTFECMVAESTNDLLRQFKADHDAGKPFFIWTNFWGPHTPCLLPEPYYSMYDPASIPEEPSFTETWEHKPRVQELYERFWGLSSGGWASWREIVARYWGYVTMLDDLIGRILADLERLGLAENTLVVFSTDHGDMMGAHRLIEKGPFTYEQCYRLPLIAAHPACAAPGSVCDEFVYLHDLFPTFLEAAGVQPPAVPDSQSILANMLGHATPTRRDSVYCAFTSQIFPFEQRMLRTRTHKFVYNRSDFGELYDMVNDPWELRNLVDLPETRALQQDLMARLRAHMERLDDPLLRPFDMIRDVY
ncbi:MAG: sulfatase-like hydrolase/transferase, partial [Chloroflexota bacterium]